MKGRETGVLRSLRLQTVGHDLAIKQQVILYHSYWGTVTNIHTHMCVYYNRILYKWYIKYLLQREKRQISNCCVKGPITICEEQHQLSYFPHKELKDNNLYAQTNPGLYKHVRSIIGINVSHIQRGNLSSDFVSMLPSKTETQFFNIPKALSFKKLFHLSLYQRLVF